jgi:hypothetical protein
MTSQSPASGLGGDLIVMKFSGPTAYTAKFKIKTYAFYPHSVFMFLCGT